VRYDAKSCRRFLGHPDWQMRQRSITLLDNIGSFTTKSMLANNPESLTVPWVKAVTNGYLELMRMGSMLLARWESEKAIPSKPSVIAPFAKVSMYCSLPSLNSPPPSMPHKQPVATC
jgi:hypothetical protein